MKKLVYLLFLCSFSTINSNAQEKTSFTQEEVIYARKHGMALTMIVLKPEKTNGKAIVNVVSGNWISNNSKISRELEKAEPFLESGYTVFLTMHSSNPRFDIAEGATDIKHAVQYIRFNAKKNGYRPR